MLESQHTLKSNETSHHYAVTQLKWFFSSQQTSGGNCSLSRNESDLNPISHHRQTGWPLSLDAKVIIHLTELDRSQLGPAGKLERGHFYFHLSHPTSAQNHHQNPAGRGGLQLCLKLRALSGEAFEVRIPHNALLPPSHENWDGNMAFSQKWFEETIFRSSSDERLLSALQFCVVSFERSIDKIDPQLLASGVRSNFNGSGQRLVPSSSSASFSSSPYRRTGSSLSSSGIDPFSTTRDNELLLSSMAAAGTTGGGLLLADECQCLCGIINSSLESTTADDGPFQQSKYTRKSVWKW